MKTFFARLIESVESMPQSLSLFVLSFFALIVARLTIENVLGLFEPNSFFYFFFEFTHTFLFFLCSFILLLPLVRFAGGINLQKAANVLLFGFLIILTPPIIDTFVFRGGGFWSFYEFDGFLGLIKRYFTLFGETPNIGITYGVRIEVVIVTFALGLYAYLKSRNIIKSLLVSLLAYTILFILGTFPSWLTLGILAFQKSFLAINTNDVAALFLAPETILARDLADFRSVLNVKMSLMYGLLAVFLTGLLLWHEYPKYFISLWKNARMPQLVYHAGLLLLGMALAAVFTEASFSFSFFELLSISTLLAACEAAWLASVVANDVYDTGIDSLTNPDRPLVRKIIPLETYKTLGWLFFFVSLLLSGIVHFSALLLLLAYQALAWLYSAPPYRLKRFPVLATLCAASAGMLILMTGFVVVSPEQNIQSLPLTLLAFLFLAYALCLPIKDFKDVLGDQTDHVYTLPVILGTERSKLLIGALTFLFYIVSPILLNARALFVPAILFGSLAYWTIQKGTIDTASIFSFRRLPGLVLTITALYGTFIVFVLFV